MLSFRRRRKFPEPGNEEKLFTMLYGKYYGLVKNTAMKILTDETEAEEIVQEVFLFILPRIGRIMSYDDSQIKSYLYIVTQGRSLNRRDLKLKRQAKEAPFPEDEEYVPVLGGGPSAEECYFQRLTIEELGKLMNQVPENYRNAFYLKHELGYNDREIAEAMGIKQQSVRVYTNRAEKTLRRLAREGELESGR